MSQIKFKKYYGIISDEYVKRITNEKGYSTQFEKFITENKKKLIRFTKKEGYKNYWTLREDSHGFSFCFTPEELSYVITERSEKLRQMLEEQCHKQN